MIEQRKLVTAIALVSMLMLVLTACSRNDPEPTATPEPAPIEEAAPAIEEPEAAEEEGEAVAEEEADSEETPAEDVAAAEEITASEEITDSEEIAVSDEMTASEEITSSQEITDSQEIAVTDESVAQAEMAGPSGPLTLVSARQLTEIIDEKNPAFAAISPDGAHIVWAQQGSKRKAPGQFCVFTFSNADKVCTDVPEEYEGYPYQLYWSPDSTQVAFTESPVTLGLESDIWVFTVGDGSFANRTDDGVIGSYMQAEPGSYALDLMPMWNQVDGQIYFWRVVPLGDSEFQTGIYSVDAVEGEAIEVRDLTDVMAGKLPMYNMTYISMDGMSAISPDGTKIAAALTEVSNFAVTGNSLWLIDVSDVEAEPQELMTYDDFQSAYPIWQNLPGLPMGLSWLGDSSAVVVNTFSNDTHSPLQVYYDVDVAGGEITPVVDFSSVESLDALFEPTDTGIVLRYYSPWTASLSPADDSLIMFNDLGGTAGVMQGMLPPDGELPPVLAAADTPLSGGTTRSSRAVDGKVLIYGVLLTFE